MHKRALASKMGAITERRHWRAFANSFAVTSPPVEHLLDYVLRRQDGYPKHVSLATPIGTVEATMFLPDDRLTVNEIFCRLDYEVSPGIRTAVDFGSNVGISALYFLSRNPEVKVWLYEPNPANVTKLTEQVAPYADRVVLNPVGVAAEDGTLEFGFEPTGRYGGAGLDFPEKVQLDVHSAERVLSEIIAERGRIDVLKVDIESLEEEILLSLSKETASKIELLLVEGEFTPGLLDETHTPTVYGPITRFERRT
ncbi:FkbM family methyltransferase [Histidinibacterium aquaticum]|uniref:FkbM family methyltransferase n=1 Tax=Histidinibacterium aquaticum TaxID=2613962 RepID=A0A5J5GAZ9_9RHOB|nr:FkbM family methyltransferase [Histidinibacterium aquaticum]KAA9005083.1 FkbM family methyltransferase [Histidinibacterium aquaticum]